MHGRPYPHFSPVPDYYIIAAVRPQFRFLGPLSLLFPPVIASDVNTSPYGSHSLLKHQFRPTLADISGHLRSRTFRRSRSSESITLRLLLARSLEKHSKCRRESLRNTSHVFCAVCTGWSRQGESTLIATSRCVVYMPATSS